jgi:copper chaperone CopZ
MKTFQIIFLFIFAILLGACGQLSAQKKQATVAINGNCEMCKKRIDKAAKIEGVSKASWSEETKMLTVSFDSTKTNLDAVQAAIAKAGYESEGHEAAPAAYTKLPSCCQYTRKATLAPAAPKPE